MKKELRILVILIAVLLVGTVGYYFMPKKFGKNVNPSEVDHINVFDGNTGTGFTITDSEDIEYIVANIQGISMKRDGISELLQYDCVEHIDVVETDEMFVEVSRKFFPEVACALDDPRVEVHYDDGLRFLRNKKAKYDLIINDSTDPFGHTEGLFTKEFYGSCYSALKEDGIMVYQHGSPFYDEDELACRSMHRKAFRSFPISRVYQAHIPTCPSGYWLFGFASKKYHPIKDFKPREWDALNIETWYYTTHLHMGAFMLPKYVEDLLKEEEK